MRCQKCFFENPQNMRYCGQCGALLLKTPVNNLFRVGERKNVTILFSDLSNFTALSSKLDPEDISNILQFLYREIEIIIKRYGGTVDKFIGDEVMALFGVPTIHEDDPIRAIKAALEIHKTVSKKSKKFNKIIEFPLTMHSGINTGLVVTQTSQKGVHEVTGDMVNVASRFVNFAQSNEIIVGYNTFQRAKGYFNFKELNPIIFKGKKSSILTYKVINENKNPDKINCIHNLSTKFTGRKTEFAKINHAIFNLQQNKKGSIVLLTGDAGIGKSRLITEIKNNNIENNKTGKNNPAKNELLWFEGRANAYGRTQSYMPFVEIIKKIANINDSDDNVITSQKINDTVNNIFSNQNYEIIPSLYSLLNLKHKTGIEKYQSGDVIMHQIFRSIYLFFEQLSQKKPTVLVFEDFHWADSSSIELLKHIISLAGIFPILIIIAGRSWNFSNRWISFQNFISRFQNNFLISIHLSTLNANDCHLLVCNILNLDTLSEELTIINNTPQQTTDNSTVEHLQTLSYKIQNIILRKAEGNPLYVEELIRSLIANKILFKDNSSEDWQISDIEGRLQIPNSISDLISNRIDHLDDNLKKILKTASVIGRHFLLSVLQNIINIEKTTLINKLSELVHLEFIREKNTNVGDGYIFNHSLIKETAYQKLLISQRQKLHRKTGKAIEYLFTEKLDDHSGILAYHYARAKNWENAHHYLLKAGDQACNMAADVEIMNHYKKAMAAYKRVFGNRWEPFTLAKLERKMGEALFRRGKHGQAFKYFQRAMKYLEKPFPESTISIHIAVIKVLITQSLHLLLPNIFVNSKKITEDKTAEELFHIFDALGWIDYFHNRKRLLYNALSGLNYSEHNGYQTGIIKGCFGISVICATRGYFKLADRYNHRLEKLSKEANNSVVSGSCYLSMALRQYYSNNWETAAKYYLLSANEYKVARDYHKWGNSAVWAAFIYNYITRYSESMELSEKIIRIGRESGDDQLLGWGFHCRGINLLCIGALKSAEQNLLKAIALLQSVPDYYYGVLAVRDLGRCFLKSGNYEKAVTLFYENTIIIEKQNLKGPPVIFFYNTMAQTHLYTAQQLTGKKRKQSLKKMKAVLKKVLKKNKKFKCDRHQTISLLGSYKWLTGANKKAEKLWEQALILAKKADAKYDLACIYMEIGEKTGEILHLNKAAELFLTIGAKLNYAVCMKVIKIKKQNIL